MGHIVDPYPKWGRLCCTLSEFGLIQIVCFFTCISRLNVFPRTRGGDQGGPFFSDLWFFSGFTYKLVFGWFGILSIAERTLKQSIMKTPGSSGLCILSFEVWTIFAHVVHSYTSGFYATRVLRGYSSRNRTHTVLQKAEGLAIKHNSPAEYCRPQTNGF